jgi:integrase
MMSPITLILDRVFPVIGRIKRATGTTKPSVKRKMSEMLTDLYEQGRLDLLREIRDGRLPLMEVYDAYRRHALDELPTGPEARPLATTMRAWIDKLEPGVDCSPEHIVSLGQSLMKLTDAELTGFAEPRIADLPAILDALRDSLGKPHPRWFNLVRSAASGFVRATMKKDHRLWAAISAVEVRKVPKPPPRPDLTVEWMRNVFPAPDTDAQDACAWAMALTGMGPKEYWGRWELMADRIRIYGTKRDARVRDVPLVQPIAVPQISREAFRQRLEHRTKQAVTPYDFRRTFARWMERAGVMRSRRKYYLGHAAGDVTSLYEAHEIDGYLVSDAQLLRRSLGFDEPTPQPLRKVE